MKRKSTILGLDGNPIQKDDLTQEIATAKVTGVRNVWNYGSIADNLTPSRLAQILRGAAEGDIYDYLTLAEEMEEREPHYGSVLGTRKRAVTKLAVTVEAASDDKQDIKLADAVREMIRKPEFRKAKKALMDALGKGYSVVEMSWDTSKVPWIPRNRNEVVDGVRKERKGYKWRDQRFFVFDRTNGDELRLLDDENPMDGIPLQPYRFIRHVPQLKMGLPIRAGLARLVAVSYMCKSYALTDWMAFAEVFGMPIRVGRYGPNASHDDIQTLISAIANIGSDAAAAIPESMRIEFIETAKASGGHELFNNLADWLDKQVSKAVLGQTMTTDDGSSQSQANVHNEVREDIQEDDANDLADTLNDDFVRAFIDLNFGQQENYPRIEINIPQPENLELMSKALERLVPLGLRVEESQVRDKFGFSDPDDKAILLTSQGTNQDTGLDSAKNHQHCTHCEKAINEVQGHNHIDSLIDDALGDEWEEQLAPIIDPIEHLVNKSTSYEEFIKRLPELLDDMDSTELVKQLAIKTFEARGLGDATDE